MDMFLAIALLRNTEIIDRVQNTNQYDRLGRRKNNNYLSLIEEDEEMENCLVNERNSYFEEKDQYVEQECEIKFQNIYDSISKKRDSMSWLLKRRNSNSSEDDTVQ